MGKRTKTKTVENDQLDDFLSSDDQSIVPDQCEGSAEEFSATDVEESHRRDSDVGSGVQEVLQDSPCECGGHPSSCIETTCQKNKTVDGRMRNISFVMITVDRRKARNNRNAPNYVESSIKSIIKEGFPTERNLYLYDDASPNDYVDSLHNIHSCVQVHHFDVWGADKGRAESGWNRNSYHTFRSLEHHVENHEETEWICLIEDDIEIVNKGILGFELAMTRTPKNANTLTCYTPNIQNTTYRPRPNEVWIRNPAQNYPNNVFSVFHRDFLLRILRDRKQNGMTHTGAADLAIQSYMAHRRIEPNYALRKQICQHIGDVSSVGNRPVRRSPHISMCSNLYIYIAGIFGLPPGQR